VPFTVAQKTLERLEWSSILDRLRELTGTPRARARLEPGEGERVATALFEADAAGVRERLAETREAREILDAGDRPPISGVHELVEVLRRARKGGVLGVREVLEVSGSLRAIRETRRFLLDREAAVPQLSDLAFLLSAHPKLEARIDRCLDPSGDVRDQASPVLAAARRTQRELGTEITSRLDGILRNADIAAALSDRYFTLRNDRYVLPVRADARGKVRGIVHDASGSGTTLYIEPEVLVELNNRHKQAEIDAEREIERVLRELSEGVAEIADDTQRDLDTLAILDLAFARAALSIEMDAVEPEVGREGQIRLPQLRHPAIPADESVPNDLSLGVSFHALVISGPNAGGKTVCMKAVALAALCVRAGLQVAAARGARVDLFDAVLADIGDEQSIGENLSTFSAHMANLASIVASADANSLVVLDEIGVGTDPGEGAALAQAILECLANAGARVIATTHYGLLKEMADTDPRFENASVDFDADTLAPNYRLRMGFPGRSSATTVAGRMGVPREVLDRAQSILDREDRQLDRMLVELSNSRAALEQEQRVAAELRQETEATRDEYRRKLAALQERRDKLYRALRDDLDRSFKDARGQIAAVIRDLQRAGTAQDAARATQRLEALEAQARRQEQETGVAPEPAAPREPMDWNRARPGDAVQLVGGSAGTLAALPDRRGRVAVTLGSSRVLVPMERVGRAHSQTLKPTPKPTTAAKLEPAAEEWQQTGRCDLRGLRVDEALDALSEALDRAVTSGRHRLVVVHGIGTGGLRRAVREALHDSRYVTGYEGAAPDEGGDGATIALLQ
jgi:DNA mismatch repair protein MutS2